MGVTNSKYVLIVDKDTSHSSELSTVLLAEGYGVIMVDDLNVMLRIKTEKETVVAVLFDYEGQDSTLISHLMQLRENFGSSTLMVLMQKFSVEAFRAAVAAGFNEFLAKPVGREELVSLIKRKTQDTFNTKSLDKKNTQ